MASLKLKQTDANQTNENQVSLGNSKPVAAVTDGTVSPAHPSPALDLQKKLNDSLNVAVMSEVGPSKIPVGWALLGLGVACGVFWTAVVAAPNLKNPSAQLKMVGPLSPRLKPHRAEPYTLVQPIIFVKINTPFQDLGQKEPRSYKRHALSHRLTCKLLPRTQIPPLM